MLFKGMNKALSSDNACFVSYYRSARIVLEYTTVKIPKLCNVGIWYIKQC